MKWYAVMKDKKDEDWGTGSYQLENAERMAREIGGEAYVAVIEEGVNPICIEEIHLT